MAVPSTAVEKARQLIEAAGGIYLGQLTCGCHVYELGDGGATVSSEPCHCDHEDEVGGIIAAEESSA